MLPSSNNTYSRTIGYLISPLPASNTNQAQNLQRTQAVPAAPTHHAVQGSVKRAFPSNPAKRPAPLGNWLETAQQPAVNESTKRLHILCLVAEEALNALAQCNESDRNPHEIGGTVKTRIMTATDANAYEGETISEKLHDKNRSTSGKNDVYQGELKDGKPHGKGKMNMPHGIVYEGRFSNGKLNGQGVLRSANGVFCEARFSNNKLHGKGEVTEPSGAVYEGDFSNGEREGLGKLTLPAGVRYQGEFRNGDPHGPGKLYSAQGQLLLEGPFNNGKFAGRRISNVPS